VKADVVGRGRDVLLALCYVAAAAWNCTNNGTGTCITVVLLSRARFILKWDFLYTAYRTATICLLYITPVVLSV